MKKYFWFLIVLFLAMADLYAGITDSDTVWTVPTYNDGGQIYSLKFCPPDEQEIAVGCQAIELRFYRSSDGKLSRTFIPKLEGKDTLYPGMAFRGIWSICFSPDGKYVAASNGICYNVWNYSTGQIVAVLNAPEYKYPTGCRSICFSPDGNYIAGSFSETDGLKFNEYQIKVWDTKNFSVIKVIEKDSIIKELIGFTPNGKYLAYWKKGYGTLYSQTGIWDSNPANILYKNSIAKGVFSQDGKLIAFVYPGGHLLIYDMEKKVLIRDTTFSKPDIKTLTFTPDSKYLIFEMDNSDKPTLISVFDILQNEIIYTYFNQYMYYGDHLSFDYSYALEVSKNSDYLLTGGFIGFVKLYSKWNNTNVPIIKNEMLNSIYPNPATAIINIDFNLPEAGKTQINLIDIKGNIINKIFDGILNSGENHIQWNTNKLSSGIYLIQIKNPKYFNSFNLIINK